MRAKSEIVYQKQTNPYAQNKPKATECISLGKEGEEDKEGEEGGRKGQEKQSIHRMVTC